MRKLVLATGNRHKVGELKSMLSALDVQVLCLADYPDAPEAVEDGETFEANAIKKAMHVARETGEIALADDSGLVIEALDGRPGVHSARYAPTNNERIARVLHEMSGVPKAERTAWFVCVAAVADPEGNVATRKGTCEGRITQNPFGSAGFGYDPIFYVPELRQTMAQLAPPAKNRISHRGAAMDKMLHLLKSIFMDGVSVHQLPEEDPD
ncbi:XTP/dITP diphosphatase [Candidatus Sumerlaeota bacterium]|nr:XTP/dITP diphosphatase [Candidatus Sumerlaeota bacterium]